MHIIRYISFVFAIVATAFAQVTIPWTDVDKAGSSIGDLAARDYWQLNGKPVGMWHRLGTVMWTDMANTASGIGEPNVIYESGAHILSGTVFKMWYSSNTTQMSYAESYDGITWSQHPSNPIVANIGRSSIVKNGATYHMYGFGGGTFKHLTSADGIAWAEVGTNVIPPGPVGAWDEGGPANTHTWIESGTWYMLYEATTIPGTVWKIGLATSPDGATWTKYVGNPVITNGSGSASGPWLTKVGATYYAWVHASTSAMSPTDISRFHSSDLHTWTNDGVVFRRGSEDEGANTETGQVADPSIVEVDGQAYMFYGAYQNNDAAMGAIGRIKLAVAPVTIAQLVQTTEGASHGDPLLPYPYFRTPIYARSNIYANGALQVSGRISPPKGSGVEIQYNTDLPNPGLIAAFDRTAGTYKGLGLVGSGIAFYASNFQSAPAIATINANGLSTTTGIRAGGSAVPSTGAGVEIQYSSGLTYPGLLAAYDRSASQFKGIGFVGSGFGFYVSSFESGVPALGIDASGISPLKVSLPATGTTSTSGVSWNDIAVYRLGASNLAVDALGGTSVTLTLRESGTTTFRAFSSSGTAYLENALNAALVFRTNGTTAMTITNGQRVVLASVPEYADNAAAVAAGLAVGTVYRAGDLLKVVH